MMSLCPTSFDGNIEPRPVRVSLCCYKIPQLRNEARGRFHVIFEMNVIMAEVLAVTHQERVVNVFLRAPSSSFRGIAIFLFDIIKIWIIFWICFNHCQKPLFNIFAKCFKQFPPHGGFFWLLRISKKYHNIDVFLFQMAGVIDQTLSGL